MTKKDDLAQELWEKHIGTLPKGFFIDVSSSQLWLCYGGPGYKDLIESGGKKPPEDQNHANICMHSVSYEGPESVGRMIVIGYIQEWVKMTQEKLPS